MATYLDHRLPKELANRYEERGTVLQGGMSYVHRCFDTLLGKEVALKFLKEKYTYQKGFQDRFDQEFTVLQALYSPNIIKVFEHGYTSEGIPYFSMEWINGVSVHDAHMSHDGLLPLVVVHWIMQGLLAALEELHLAKIVHRDIKLQNIMITYDGVVKLIDFGLAKNTGDENGAITSVGEIVGTAGFLTPEHVKPKTLDERSDLFGAGWVLYVLLTGKLPPLCDMEPMEAIASVYKGSYTLHKLSEFVHLNGTGEGLQTLLDKLLAHDRRKRFQSATTAALAMERVFGLPITDGKNETIEAFLHEIQGLQDSILDSLGLPTVAGSSFFEGDSKQSAAKMQVTEWHVDGFEWAELPTCEGFIGNFWGNEDECPPTRVKLGAFAISKHAIPASLFMQFLNEMPEVCGSFEGNEYSVLIKERGVWKCKPGAENLPVNCVTHGEAQAFCLWLSERLGEKIALPTEAQWEAAASWDVASGQKYLYPWGMAPDYRRAHVQRRWTTPEESLADVRAYSEHPSPCGGVQMVGNVWEWCRDTYLQDAYARYLGKDPWLERKEKDARVIRGGDLGCQIHNLRTSLRGYARESFRLKFISFRVVKEL